MSKGANGKGLVILRSSLQSWESTPYTGNWPNVWEEKKGSQSGTIWKWRGTSRVHVEPCSMKQAGGSTRTWLRIRLTESIQLGPLRIYLMVRVRTWGNGKL